MKTQAAKTDPRPAARLSEREEGFAHKKAAAGEGRRSEPALKCRLKKQLGAKLNLPWIELPENTPERTRIQQSSDYSVI